MHQGIFIGAHVLRLVNDKDSLCHAIWLHLSVFDHSGGLRDHAMGVVDVAYSAKQVKAIGMESLDFDKMCGISDEFHQPLLEFHRRRAREGKHQQLLVLYVFEQEQRGEFVNQNPRLAASGTCRHDDATRLFVGDNFHLFL